MGDTLLWSSLSCWQGCREGGEHPTSLWDMGSVQPCCPQLLRHPPAPDQVWNRVAQTTGGSGTPLTLGWGRWGSPCWGWGHQAAAVHGGEGGVGRTSGYK